MADTYSGEVNASNAGRSVRSLTLSSREKDNGRRIARAKCPYAEPPSPASSARRRTDPTGRIAAERSRKKLHQKHKVTCS